MLTGIAAAQGSADDVGGLFGLDDRVGRAFLSATWHSIADKASDCVGEKEKGHPLVHSQPGLHGRYPYGRQVVD